MRARTTLALGTVLAATLLTGVGTTSAAFSDNASIPVTVGAGQVTVSASPATLVLVPPRGSGSVAVTNGGSVEAVLTVTAIDAQGRPLADCPKITVTAAPEEGAPAQGIRPCSADGHGVDLLELASGATTTITVEATAFGQRWTGGLRVTLSQGDGGFSDSADVAVQVAPR
ncbi:hypothetical protein ACI797_08745 [Geodermatophilus sp. SYSU D00691]